jgi:methyl-accepting chemotaxis protein
MATASTIFGVCVALGLLAWRDWRPLLMGAAAIAVHHLVFNYLQSMACLVWWSLCTPGFIWWFHGLFVVVQTAILILLAVRMAQDARSASEVAKLAGIINQEPGF